MPGANSPRVSLLYSDFPTGIISLSHTIGISGATGPTLRASPFRAEPSQSCWLQAVCTWRNDGSGPGSCASQEAVHGRSDVGAGHESLADEHGADPCRLQPLGVGPGANAALADHEPVVGNPLL